MQQQVCPELVGPLEKDASVGARLKSLANAISPFELICGLGLACNFVWCTLEGHSEGFVSAMAGLDKVVNSRVFFQLGFFILACAMIALPRILEQRSRTLEFAIPVASCVATVLFAASYQLGGAAAVPLCIIGLICSGVGYCWLVTRFYLLIVRRRGFVSAIVATAFCLVIKEAILSILLIAPAGVQVVMAAAMPLCMAGLYFYSQRMVPENASPSREQSHGDLKNVNLDVVFAAVFALLLSVIRGYSRLGMWGVDVFPPSDFVYALLRIAVVAALVFGFAGLAIVPYASRPAASRFHAPIVVVFAGLLFICLQTYFGDSSVPYLVFQYEEYFGHMAFWSSMCVLFEQDPQLSIRKVGIPLAVYSGASVLFVALMSTRAILVFGFMIFVVYIAVVLLAHNMASMAIIRTEAQVSEVRLPSESTRKSVLEAVRQACQELAEANELSPREAQILTYVVEGRSRAHISAELHLSDSTVKTHMSRIYAKLNVSNRQELCDYIFGTTGE